MSSVDIDDFICEKCGQSGKATLNIKTGIYQIDFSCCENKLGKPDIETESLRIWKHNKKAKDEYKETNGIEVKIDGETFKLCGFIKCFDKKTNDFKIAYKFKHSEKMVLYYIPKETKGCEEILKEMRGFLGTLGYHFQNIEDNFKNISSQKHLFG